MSNNENKQAMLSEIDKQELFDSGLAEDWIVNSEAETVVLEAAIARGFSSPLLSEENIISCLYLPFFDRHGKRIVDEVTGKEVGVIKPRYTDTAKQYNMKLPKYLCLPGHEQSRQYIHYPKGYDWSLVHDSDDLVKVFVTEGWKKAESASSKGLPTICIWSVYCFNESDMASPLIPELRDLISLSCVETIIVFDSDKVVKEGVAKAEYSLGDKIYRETSKLVYKIDLPQQFNGVSTKGLDDFLVLAGSEEFKKLLVEPLRTPYVEAKAAHLIPKIPRNQLPDIYQAFIDDTDEQYEGCLEISPLALFCSTAVILGSKITVEGKKANIYAFGVAKQTSGKSEVARQNLAPIFEINQELESNYQERIRLKNTDDEEIIKSRQLIVSRFTEEGLTYLLAHHLEQPCVMYFDTEEFDGFFEDLSKERNKTLPQFITQAYDARILAPAYTKETLTRGSVPKSIHSPTLTIGGVATEAGIIDSMPKGAREKGFNARFIKFIGAPRFGKCVVRPKPINQNLKNQLKEIYCLIRDAADKLPETRDVLLSEEANVLYSREYRLQKTLEELNPSNPLLPECRRALTDYAFKLSLQFEVIRVAEGFITNIYQEDRAIAFTKALSELSISVQSMQWALAWVEYFRQTAKYFYDHYVSHDTVFDEKISKILEILEQHPQGILLARLQREVGLHREPKQRAELNMLIDYLRDFNEVELVEQNRKNSYKVIFKKHLKLSLDHK